MREKDNTPDKYDGTLQMFAKSSFAEPDMGRLAFIKWLIQQGRMQSGGEIIFGPSSGALAESSKPLVLAGPKNDFEQQH